MFWVGLAAIVAATALPAALVGNVQRGSPGNAGCLVGAVSGAICGGLAIFAGAWWAIGFAIVVSAPAAYLLPAAVKYGRDKSPAVKAPIAFSYRNASGGRSDRVVIDWVLEGDYITGWCVDAREERTFRLDRVIEWHGDSQSLIGKASQN